MTDCTSKGEQSQENEDCRSREGKDVERCLHLYDEETEENHEQHERTTN